MALDQACLSPCSATARVPPHPNARLFTDICIVQDADLKNLMISWYYAGYYTGLYEGQQKAYAEAQKE